MHGRVAVTGAAVGRVGLRRLKVYMDGKCPAAAG